MTYLRLFFEFFKVGLFSVGGGLATIPFLQDLGARTGWFSAVDLADMIAVSESTPGPMGVNMSTYVGFTCGLKQGGLGPAGGVLGAIVGVLGLITPSIIVILIVAGFLKKFRDSKIVNGVFAGLRPASTALITAAGLSVAAMALIREIPAPAASMNAFVPYWPAILIAVGMFLCMRLPKLKNLHPIHYLAAAAVMGVDLKLKTQTRRGETPPFLLWEPAEKCSV